MKLRRTKEFYLREFGEMYTKPIENIFKEDGSDNYLYSQHEMFIEFFMIVYKAELNRKEANEVDINFVAKFTEEHFHDFCTVSEKFCTDILEGYRDDL